MRSFCWYCRSKCWKSAWNNETSRPNQYGAWYYWADPDNTYAWCSSASSCLKDWKKLEEKLPGDQPCKAYGVGKNKKCQYGIRTWCKPIETANNKKYCVHTMSRAQKSHKINVHITTRRIRPKRETTWVKCETDEDCDLTEIMKLDMRSPKLEYNWALDYTDMTDDRQVWQDLVAIPACISSGSHSESFCRKHDWSGAESFRKDYCTCAREVYLHQKL